MSQRSYDPLDYLDAGIVSTIKEATQKALQKRNADLKAYRKQYGNGFFGFALRGQVRPYKSFGVPDGSIRTVYYIESNDPVLPHGRAPIAEREN